MPKAVKAASKPAPGTPLHSSAVRQGTLPQAELGHPLDQVVVVEHQPALVPESRASSCGPEDGRVAMFTQQ